MIFKILYFAFHIGIFVHIGFVKCDLFEECLLAEPENFVASSKNCAYFIFCDGDNSYEGECSEGDYFNEVYQTCDPKEMVDCKIGSDSSISTSSPNSSISTSEPNPTISTPLTTLSTSTIWQTTTIGATETTPPPSACPAVDDPTKLVFLPHQESCSDYYLCFHGTALHMHCSSMLHFDVNTGKCDYPEKVKCLNDVTNIKQQCKSHTVDVYPHATNCNYYYFCSNGFLLLQECPFQFGWDYERRTCVAIRQAKCYNN